MSGACVRRAFERGRWPSAVECCAGGHHRRSAGVHGVDDLGGVDALRVGRGGVEVGVFELALDDVHRHPFARELDSVGMPQLMWRRTAVNIRLRGEFSQFGAGGARGSRAAAGRAVDDAEQRTDREPDAMLAPAAEVLKLPIDRSRPRDAGRRCRDRSAATPDAGRSPAAPDFHQSSTRAGRSLPRQPGTEAALRPAAPARHVPARQESPDRSRRSSRADGRSPSTSITAPNGRVRSSGCTRTTVALCSRAPCARHPSNTDFPSISLGNYSGRGRVRAGAREAGLGRRPASRGGRAILIRVQAQSHDRPGSGSSATGITGRV